jgi:hypothetical protein
MGHKDYRPGEKISRRDAIHDLKDDVARFTHTTVDVWVNIARICGISERDRSQMVGRVLAIVTTLAVIVLGVTGWLI